MYRNQRAKAHEGWGNEEKTVQNEYKKIKTKIKTEAEEIHHCDDPYLPEDDATPFEELIEADAGRRHADSRRDLSTAIGWLSGFHLISPARF